MKPMSGISAIWQPYKLLICLAGVSIFSIGISLVLLVKSVQTQTPIQFSSSQEILGDSNQASTSANQKRMIHVDVEGGVRSPGLYVLPIASRIDDVIAKAGGLSEEADEEAIAKQLNRASVVVDGAKIYVPKKGDYENTSHIIQSNSSSTMTSDNILVNINTASQNELEALSGIGPVTAKKIIDNRPYQTLEELVSKKALGQALFEKIKGNLSL